MNRVLRTAADPQIGWQHQPERASVRFLPREPGASALRLISQSNLAEHNQTNRPFRLYQIGELFRLRIERIIYGDPQNSSSELLGLI